MARNKPIELKDIQLKPGELESMASAYGARIPLDIWDLMRRLEKHFTSRR